MQSIHALGLKNCEYNGIYAEHGLSADWSWVPVGYFKTICLAVAKCLEWEVLHEGRVFWVRWIICMPPGVWPPIGVSVTTIVFLFIFCVCKCLSGRIFKKRQREWAWAQMVMFSVSQALAQVAWIMAWWEGKKLEQNLALNNGLLWWKGCPP